MISIQYVCDHMGVRSNTERTYVQLEIAVHLFEKVSCVGPQSRMVPGRSAQLKMMDVLQQRRRKKINTQRHT